MGQSEYKRIKAVVPQSIAHKAGIEAGDYLESINGHMIQDIIDFKYYSYDSELELGIRKKNGERWLLDIENENGEDLGMEFEYYLLDEPKRCSNKCIFCFVDQLPGNMRKTLYFKDDDWRLSFLNGNYVTLSNLKDNDLERIIKYKTSPLYISVHATDTCLRRKMVNNPQDKLLDILKRFKEEGIFFNCQVVLCPGINDGKYLDKTLKDLFELWPWCMSVAVVPVGLTRYREELFEVKKCDRGISNQVLETLNRYQEEFKKTAGTSFVFPADEFFVSAGREIPDYDYYEDFKQLENGIGLIAKFRKEFFDTMDYWPKSLKSFRSVCIITSASAYIFLKDLLEGLKKINNLDLDVYCINNDYFGPHVTVAGLITGSDIINQLKQREISRELLIPNTMLKEGTDLFLDNISIDEIGKKLGVNVEAVPVHGVSLVENILGNSTLQGGI